MWPAADMASMEKEETRPKMTLISQQLLNWQFVLALAMEENGETQRVARYYVSKLVEEKYLLIRTLSY